jgi:hypothetical protein
MKPTEQIGDTAMSSIISKLRDRAQDTIVGELPMPVIVGGSSWEQADGHWSHPRLGTWKESARVVSDLTDLPNAALLELPERGESGERRYIVLQRVSSRRRTSAATAKPKERKPSRTVDIERAPENLSPRFGIRRYGRRIPPSPRNVEKGGGGCRNQPIPM